MKNTDTNMGEDEIQSGTSRSKLFAIAVIKCTALTYYSGLNLYLLMGDIENQRTLSCTFSAIQLMLIWWPASVAPSFWKNNLKLRRTVVLAYPIVLTSASAYNIGIIENPSDAYFIFIWHGLIALVALTIKWWWNSDKEGGPYIIVAVLVGILLRFTLL
jgi:hypothetical protein